MKRCLDEGTLQSYFDGERNRASQFVCNVRSYGPRIRAGNGAVDFSAGRRI